MAFYSQKMVGKSHLAATLIWLDHLNFSHWTHWIGANCTISLHEWMFDDFSKEWKISAKNIVTMCIEKQNRRKKLTWSTAYQPEKQKQVVVLGIPVIPKPVALSHPFGFGALPTSLGKSTSQVPMKQAACHLCQLERSESMKKNKFQTQK